MPAKRKPRDVERRTWDSLNEGDFTGEEELAAEHPLPIHLERTKSARAKKATPARKPGGKAPKQGGS